MHTEQRRNHESESRARPAARPGFVGQAKLDVGALHDPLEAEADAMADRVMRMPDSPLVQRKCSMCEEEDKVQAKATDAPLRAVDQTNATGANEEIAQQIEQSRGGGNGLDGDVRSFMESRFGADFASVRIHTGDGAARMNRALNAQAFTVGGDIFFDTGKYNPASSGGKHLLAHELAHTLQQSAARPIDGHDANRDSTRDSPLTVQARRSWLQRKVHVNKPTTLIDNPTGKGLVQTNAETIENYLRVLCSGGSVAVDKKTGVVSIAKEFCPKPLPGNAQGPRLQAPSDKSKEPVGCGCLCDMIDSATDYTIVVDDKDWPHTLGTTVTTPSPNSPKLWGTATVSGKTTTIDPWLVLGHEFCGHAWLADQGLKDDNATRGEGGHQETVSRENELRKEHGIEARGGFKDPYCGESFWKDKTGAGGVNWSSYLKICEAWRTKTYGGKYKISDKIP